MLIMFCEFNTLELTFCVEFIIMLLREPTLPRLLTPPNDSHPSLPSSPLTLPTMITVMITEMITMINMMITKTNMVITMIT